MKRNLFVRKVECWDCQEKFHLVILTKYNGVLCKKCYESKYNEMKQLFHDFMASFEVNTTPISKNILRHWRTCWK